jgi:hypothetical protein
MEMPEGAQVKAPWGFMSPGAFLLFFCQFPLPKEGTVFMRGLWSCAGRVKNEMDSNRGRRFHLETAFHHGRLGLSDFHTGADGSVRLSAMQENL